MPAKKHHRLIIVLGDQLDRSSAALRRYDPATDAIWMTEAREESTHVWSHKARIALFLSAMRHFRDDMIALGRTVIYQQLDTPRNSGRLDVELATAIRRHRVESLLMIEAGDHRVQTNLESAARDAGIPLEILPDQHFLSSIDDFRQHASGRKSLRMEFFYREMRKRHGILMEGDQPMGGAWNYDQDNRGTFGKQGPGTVPPPPRFKPDKLSKSILDLVELRYADHPGSLQQFNWPVTPKEAEQALESFLLHRLPEFGKYQDAMWANEPFLYHSLISAALNLKLLDPLTVIRRAETEYLEGRAPLAAVEGFIRQILGWREYVRGVYWLHMPDYRGRNALKAKRKLPEFFWTADTDMQCLRQAIGQTLEHGYAHHIQRLMITGLYALLAGIDPKQVHEWYLAVYVDAVEWVELPNTLGMSQYADGGIMASKPYVASGKYIQRMSNYCSGCRFDPSKRTGATACPFTNLYWDFLLRHQETLRSNPRMSLQLRNLSRLSSEEITAVQKQARSHLRG